MPAPQLSARLSLAALLALAACTPQRSVGGALAGHDASLGEVALSLSDGQALTLSANGPFTFAKKLGAGTAFTVSLTRAPARERCTVSGGTGTVPSEGEVTSVQVVCELLRYSLGGTLAGLDAAGLSLREATSQQQLAPGAGDTRFAFAQPLVWRSPYAVTLEAVPEGRECTLDGGEGVIDGDTGSVAVSCALQRFPISGTVLGHDAGVLVLEEASSTQLLQLDGGATGFAFAQTVPWDTPLQVQVRAQPERELCTVDGGTGVVRAARSDVTVSCRFGFPLSGVATGLLAPGLKLREATTGQELELVPDGGPLAFRFPAVVPEGEPYSVEVSQWPDGVTCALSGTRGVSTGPMETVRLTCGRFYGELVVSEVALSPTPDTPAWVELYNGARAPVNLLDYRLRAAQLLRDGGAGGALDFVLPDASLPPTALVVLSGKPVADLHPTQGLWLVVEDGGTTFTLPSDAGPQLSLVRGGATVDALPLLPPPQEFGQSLARRLEAPDTDGAADFVAVDFFTPGGPNDVRDGADLDGDGIPDSAERPGGTYAGLPLHAWGARENERDVFVEVDWMKPDGRGTLDPALLPRREALEKLRAVFAAHNLTLHLDTGALYHPDAGAELDPALFDLGGGNQTEFACTVTQVGTPGITSFYAIKARNAALQRRPVFHYALFGYSLADVACGGLGTSGRAELPGNDLFISLGNSGYGTGTAAQLNRLVNAQAATLMHELGHNLGLRHGGFEDNNAKPNYLSVMNYLYQFDGLPNLGPTEGDRYYFGYRALCTGAPTLNNPSLLDTGRFADPAVFRLDFSNGTSAPLAEAALDETRGLGRTGSGPVDFNFDGAFGTSVSANVNAVDGFPAACVRGSTGSDVHRDHDDWAALRLGFLRSARAGAANGALLRRRPAPALDVAGDHQPWSEERGAER